MTTSPKKPRVIPAVAYYRSRANDVEAIDRQRRLVRRLAVRCGFKIVREYIDAAADGGQIEREGLLSLVADAAEGDFAAILSVSLECVTTLPVEQSTWLFRDVRDNDVQIVTVSRGLIDWREVVRPSLLAVDKQRKAVQRLLRRYSRRDNQL